MMRRAGALLLALALFGCSRRPVGQVIDGPLAKDMIEEAWQHVLPPRASLGNNALRVVIEPSFSDFIYAIDYAPQPRNCLTPDDGKANDPDKVGHTFCYDVLVSYFILDRPSKGRGLVSKQWSFHVPMQEWRALVEGLDLRMDAWKGAPCCTMDGTQAAVERARDGKLRSVANNAEASSKETVGNPAYFAQTGTLRLLLLYGPSGKMPRNSDWAAGNTPLPDQPCNTAEFALPDPDGWGVGGECQKWMEQKQREIANRVRL